MIRKFFGGVIYGATSVFCLYLIFWWGLIDPIKKLIDHFNKDTLSLSILFWQFLKIIFREVIAVFVGVVGLFIGSILITS